MNKLSHVYPTSHKCWPLRRVGHAMSGIQKGKNSFVGPPLHHSLAVNLFVCHSISLMACLLICKIDIVGIKWVNPYKGSVTVPHISQGFRKYQLFRDTFYSSVATHAHEQVSIHFSPNVLNISKHFKSLKSTSQSSQKEFHWEKIILLHLLVTWVNRIFISFIWKTCDKAYSGYHKGSWYKGPNFFINEKLWPFCLTLYLILR